MFAWISDPSAWFALATLTLLEIVLGIDNIIFISILASRLPREQQDRARRIGLGLALIVRVLLLLSLGFVAKLTYPVVSLGMLASVGLSEEGRTLSWRDILLAVGMADQIPVMVMAVMIAVGVMLFAAGAISEFVERYPTVKKLALSFLVLIGVNLIAEGFGQHIPKGYTYFALAFSMGAELLNIQSTRKSRSQAALLGHDVGMPKA